MLTNLKSSDEIMIFFIKMQILKIIAVCPEKI